MSFGVAYSLPEQVILGCDCRGSIENPPPQPAARFDCVEKALVLTPTTVLVYAGDIEFAAFCIAHLRRALLGVRKERRHGLAIRRTLPGLLKRCWQTFPRPPLATQFIVASMLPSYSMAALKEPFRDAWSRVMQEGQQANYVDGTCLRLILRPQRGPDEPFVELPARLVYSLSGPTFSPKPCEPGQVVGIGSAGALVADRLRAYEGWLLFGSRQYQADMFSHALEGYLNDTPLEDIGGMPPVVEVSREGVFAIGRQHAIPVGGPEIRLDYADHQWSQRNPANNRTVELLSPEMLTRLQRREPQRFDDLRVAIDGLRNEAQPGPRWRAIGGGRVPMAPMVEY